MVVQHHGHDVADLGADRVRPRRALGCDVDSPQHLVVPLEVVEPRGRSLDSLQTEDGITNVLGHLLPQLRDQLVADLRRGVG